MHDHVYEKTKGNLRDFPDVGVKTCVICGLIQPEEDLSHLVSYESGTMHNWARGWGELKKPQEDISRRVARVKDLISPLDGPVLDFGCGSGAFVKASLEEGFDAKGYDPDIDFLDDELLSAGSLTNELQELGSEKYSAITLFHVIEHVYDIPKILELIWGLLKPNGFLVLETPNAKDALAEKYQVANFLKFTYWSHHPNLCTNQFLEESLSDKGFEVVSSTQVQRYGLTNHLYWLSEGKPGGHEVWPDIVRAETSQAYSKDLIRQGLADTIWIEAKKPAQDLQTQPSDQVSR